MQIIHFNFFNLELCKRPGTTYLEQSEWIGYWHYLEYSLISNIYSFNYELVVKLTEEKFQEEKKLF